jgi:hypothetical protein
MGLDTSHDCWHGAYSAFMRWRRELARVAGLPPLDLMEAFYVAGDYMDPIKTEDAYQGIRQQLPIRWQALRPDVLHALLYHSDCDGELAAELCGPLADRLSELLPLLAGDFGGHVGAIAVKTQQFIDGLRLAASLNEPVRFH